MSERWANDNDLVYMMFGARGPAYNEQYLASGRMYDYIHHGAEARRIAAQNGCSLCRMINDEMGAILRTKGEFTGS